MKKNIVISLVCILFLTGCRETRLYCEKTLIDENGILLKEELTFSFKERSMKEARALWKYTFSDADISIDFQTSALETQYSVYKNSKAVTYNIYKLDNGLEVLLSINADKLTSEEIEELGELTNHLNRTYDETARALENNGYICR